MTTVTWMPEVALNAVDAVGMEVVHLACFVLGFVVFNTTFVQQTIRSLVVKADPVTLKYMTAHANSGNYADVWDLWITLKPSDLTAETLRLAVEALVELGRGAEAAEVVTDALQRQPQLRTPACAKVVLEALANSAAVARAVHTAFCARGVVPDDKVGAAMLRVYASAGDDEAVRELCAQGLPCPPEVAAMLAEAALKRRDLDSAVRWTRSAGPEQTTAVLVGAAREGRADLCTELLRRSPLGLADLETVFARAQTAAAAMVLQSSLEALRSRSVRFDDELTVPAADVAHVALAACAEAGDLFAAMQADGKVDAECYQVMINEKIKNRAVGAAWALWGEMDSAGFAVDDLTAKALLENLRPAAADIDYALRLLSTPGVELSVSEAIVAGVLDACIRLRDVQRLMQAMATLRSVLTNEHICTLLRGYGQARASAAALALWEEVATDAGPDVVAAAVEAFVANGQVGKAVEIVLEADGAPTCTYHLLVKACGALKDAESAWKVYTCMEERNVLESHACFCTLIDLCCREGRMERAGALFRAMFTAGLSPELATYQTIVKGYCMHGELEQAVQLFTLMRTRGVKPDAALFNALLDGCARRDMAFMAEQVLNDMDEFGVAPSNATLCILVKLYGKVRDVDAAFRVVEELPARYGFDLDDKVLGALVGACVRSGRLPAAREVFARIEAPDAKVYTLLVNGSLQNDDVEGAVELVHIAIGKGVDLTADTVDAVVFLAGRRGVTVPTKVRRFAAGRTKSRSPSPSMSTCSSDGDARSNSRFYQRRAESQRWRDA